MAIYDTNPRNWKCGNCQGIIADQLLKFVYETYGGMPTLLEFYCPYCGAILEIYLDWQLPAIRSVKVAHTRPKKEKRRALPWEVLRPINLIQTGFREILNVP